MIRRKIPMYDFERNLSCLLVRTFVSTIPDSFQFRLTANVDQ